MITYYHETNNSDFGSSFVFGSEFSRSFQEIFREKVIAGVPLASAVVFSAPFHIEQIISPNAAE
jgi:hypothetical protein